MGDDVLLVDDDPQIGDLVRRRVEGESDLSVRCESDPESALEFLENGGGVDCIVSDYEMPGIDGLELLESVREDSPDVPFVLFTGRGSEAVASEAIAAGATDYLPKRLGEDRYPVIVRRIENAVESYRSRRERERTRERYETLIERSQGLITVLDPSGTVTFQSRSSENLLGRSPESMEGTQFRELVHPEDHRSFDRLCDRLADQPGASVEDFELRLRTGDGEWRYLQVVGTNQTDTVVEGYVLNGVDVTERKERERRLREERAFVDTVLDSMTDVFYAVDESGTLSRWNDRLPEVSGYDDEAIAGMEPREFVPAEDRPRIAEATEEIRDGESSVTFEADLLTRDGTRIPHEFSAAPITDDSGDVIGSVGIGRDVSDRLERERELRETKRRYDFALEASDVGVFEWNFETDESYVSPTVERLFGYERESFDGSFETVLEQVHPEDLQGVRASLQEAIESGDSYRDEFRIEREDDQQAWIGVRAQAVADGPDDQRILGAVTDITERKEREQELRRKSRAMDEAEVGITIADADREDLSLIYANEGFEAVTGYDPSFATGRNCRFLQGEATDPERVAEIREAIEDRRPVTVELRNYRADGEEFWNRLKVAPVSDDAGTVTEFVGIQEDVTERKEYERALETLHGVSRELLETESRAEIASVVANAAEAILAADAALVSLYDPETNALEPAAAIEGTERLVGEPPSFGPGEGIAWDVFVQGEGRVYDDVRRAEDAYNPDTNVRAEALVPLGEHGVFICGSESVGAFDERFLELADLLAAAAEAALDRHDREERLRERERELQERNERLRQLDGLNDRVRSVCHDVVGADTPEEIHEAVVDSLADVEWFEFAWLGTDDPGQEVLRPTARAGTGRGYLDAVTLSSDPDDHGSEPPPAVAAADGEKPVVVDAVADQLHAGDWRQAALTRDFQSALSVPVVHGDIRYGVITVHAADAGVFDRETVGVIESLASTVAAALAAVERRRGLSGGRAVDLEFTVTGTRSGLPAVLERIDGATTVDGVVVTGEGILAYGTAETASPDAVRDACDGLHCVDSVDPIEDEGAGTTFEVSMTEAPLVSAVVENGGRFRSFSLGNGVGTLRVSLPSPDRVRSFVEAICDRFPAELRARRERDGHPGEDRRESELTGRQAEALAAAHHSGYYDWPRRRTSEEIADSLGISKATFLEHLRRAESAVVGNYVEDPA